MHVCSTHEKILYRRRALSTVIMQRDIPTELRDQSEKQNAFVEVINAEKQLWALVPSKGILHNDVQDLYLKARTVYENIILNDHEVVELQDVEYSLWKLHYKHIDEFRKRIRQVSTNAASTKSGTQQDVSNVTNNVNIHVEGFKLFLSKAIEFYKDLIAKFRRCCGLLDESFLHKYSYAIHRFLVCLGDLSRYRELCKKPDQNRMWEVAATYYLEATMVWPDSGNPHNQLALLATYVGDDFLALYHCVRSLAVNEPFPDARDNIMLLFEKNRSSRLHSLSSEAHFDFSKPLKRSDSLNSNKLEGTEHVTNGKTDLWPLFVRMISFFLVKSSLEDFPYTFASAMSEVEALLAQDDTKLKASLEPYEQLDATREGPYRALQVVSILIFIIHNLSESPEPWDSAWIQLAWASTFTFLGRFLERCRKGNNHLECCPLLAAVLVFAEWLVGNDMLDKAETNGADEKVSSSKSYFFGAFVDFLNRLGINEGEVKSRPDHTALWEDYELRGFEPIAHSHNSLDFSAHRENLSKYEGGNLIRAHRIVLAAMKIVGRSSNSSRNWIFYDQLARKFYAGPRKSSVVEEDEVILFKPITRYNSAPICKSDQMSLEGMSDQTEPNSDEYLRRATSLFVVQNEAGPPSLSAWVLNRESLNVESKKGTRNAAKPELTPLIEEIPSASFTNLSICEAIPEYSSPYVAPVPSAPLLPEYAVWVKEGHGILGAPPVSGLFSNFSPSRGPSDVSTSVPGFIDAYPPVLGMSSSEWLYHYANNHNLERGNSTNHHQRPVHLNNNANNAPGTLENLHGPRDALSFDVYDRWGNPLVSDRMLSMENYPHLYAGLPLVYGAVDEQRREQLFLQPPLLQYLKEREWQLQREFPLRGPTYMGN